MEVELFIPCFIDQLYPNTAWNCIKLLEKAGCKVHYNPKQTCCGQPSFNSGYWDKTRTMAKKFITDFKPNIPIVSPSGSCTGFVRNHYPELFEEKDAEWQEQAQDITQHIFEITDFLVNQIQFTDFGAVFNHSITYHDSCSALREYGIREEPRLLLSKVKGLQLTEMNESDTCCGFGGTFSAKFDGISSSMAEQKVQNALDTEAEFITGTESSCLMHIEGYINKNNKAIKTIHIVDILASGWE